MIICRHCERAIVYDPRDGWVDPQATGDDVIWRETCDASDTFEARHEPVEEDETCDGCGDRLDRGQCVNRSCLHYRHPGDEG